MPELKTYMQRRREHDRLMAQEFIGGIFIMVLAFALMVVALNYGG